MLTQRRIKWGSLGISTALSLYFLYRGMTTYYGPQNNSIFYSLSALFAIPPFIFSLIMIMTFVVIWFEGLPEK